MNKLFALCVAVAFILAAAAYFLFAFSPRSEAKNEERKTQAGQESSTKTEPPVPIAKQQSLSPAEEFNGRVMRIVGALNHAIDSRNRDGIAAALIEMDTLIHADTGNSFETLKQMLALSKGSSASTLVMVMVGAHRIQDAGLIFENASEKMVRGYLTGVAMGEEEGDSEEERKKMLEKFAKVGWVLGYILDWGDQIPSVDGIITICQSIRDARLINPIDNSGLIERLARFVVNSRDPLVHYLFFRHTARNNGLVLDLACNWAVQAEGLSAYGSVGYLGSTLGFFLFKENSADPQMETKVLQIARALITTIQTKYISDEEVAWIAAAQFHFIPVTESSRGVLLETLIPAYRRMISDGEFPSRVLEVMTSGFISNFGASFYQDASDAFDRRPEIRSKILSAISDKPPHELLVKIVDKGLDDVSDPYVLQGAIGALYSWVTDQNRGKENISVLRNESFGRAGIDKLVRLQGELAKMSPDSWEWGEPVLNETKVKLQKVIDALSSNK